MEACPLGPYTITDLPGARYWATTFATTLGVEVVTVCVPGGWIIQDFPRLLGMYTDRRKPSQEQSARDAAEEYEAEVQQELNFELSGDQDDYARSDEEGWYYSDDL